MTSAELQEAIERSDAQTVLGTRQAHPQCRCNADPDVEALVDSL